MFGLNHFNKEMAQKICDILGDKNIEFFYNKNYGEIEFMMPIRSMYASKMLFLITVVENSYTTCAGLPLNFTRGNQRLIFKLREYIKLVNKDIEEGHFKLNDEGIFTFEAEPESEEGNVTKELLLKTIRMSVVYTEAYTYGIYKIQRGELGPKAAATVGKKTLERILHGDGKAPSEEEAEAVEKKYKELMASLSEETEKTHESKTTFEKLLETAPVPYEELRLSPGKSLHIVFSGREQFDRYMKFMEATMSHFTNKYEFEEKLMNRLVQSMKARYKERPDPTKKNKEIMHGTSIDNLDLIDVYEAFNLALRNYCFLHGYYLLQEETLEEERRINKAQKEIIMELLREHNLK